MAMPLFIHYVINVSTRNMHSGMFRWMEHDRMSSVRGRQMFSQYFEWQKRVSTCHILWVLLLLFGERKKFHFFPFFKGNVKRQLVKRELCRRPSDDDDCICVSNFFHRSFYLAPEYFQPRNVTHLLRASIKITMFKELSCHIFPSNHCLIVNQ